MSDYYIKLIRVSEAADFNHVCNLSKGLFPMYDRAWFQFIEVLFLEQRPQDGAFNLVSIMCRCGNPQRFNSFYWQELYNSCNMLYDSHVSRQKLLVLRWSRWNNDLVSQ